MSKITSWQDTLLSPQAKAPATLCWAVLISDLFYAVGNSNYGLRYHTEVW